MKPPWPICGADLRARFAAWRDGAAWRASTSGCPGSTSQSVISSITTAFPSPRRRSTAISTPIPGMQGLRARDDIPHPARHVQYQARRIDLRGAYPLSYLVNDDRKWCYYAGGFATREEAEAAQSLLKARGFVRPEIVVWTDGEYRNLRRTPKRSISPTGSRSSPPKRFPTR